MEKYSFLVILVLLAVLSYTNQASAATVVGRASATVISGDLTISVEKQLEFGVINSAANDGEIVISTTGERSVSSGIDASKGSNTYNPAKFNVNGMPNASYYITLPTTLKFTREGKEGQLTAHDFKSYSTNVGKDTSVGELNKFGQDILFIGGTLIVPAGTAGGRYRGEITVIISY